MTSTDQFFRDYYAARRRPRAPRTLKHPAEAVARRLLHNHGFQTEAVRDGYAWSDRATVPVVHGSEFAVVCRFKDEERLDALLPDLPIRLVVTKRTATRTFLVAAAAEGAVLAEPLPAHRGKEGGRCKGSVEPGWAQVLGGRLHCNYCGATQ